MHEPQRSPSDAHACGKMFGPATRCGGSALSLSPPAIVDDVTDLGFTEEIVTHAFTLLDPVFMTVRTEHIFLIRAERQLRFFERRFFWTGKGIEKAPHVRSGHNDSGPWAHKLQGPVIAESSGERIALIDLGRHLRREEQELVHIEHFFVDVAPEPTSFVGHLAKPGIKEVDLRFIALRGTGSRIRSTERKPGADVPHRESLLKPQEVDPIFHSFSNPREWVQYRFRVVDPIPWYRYRIEWDQE
jgi:hypothetical protein